MKRSNPTMPAPQPEQNDKARRFGCTESAGKVSAYEEDLAAALVELEAIERTAAEDELLRRSASVAAAMMLQDTIVTMLTLLLELEMLLPKPADSSAFHEFAGKLTSAAVAEAELSNVAIMAPAVGHA